jgi:hypothetical protein
MVSLSRFEKKFTPEPYSGCWLWTATVRGNNSYGSFSVDGHDEAAHRVAWRLYRGEIPKGMLVLHTCDTPTCVRPEHLRLGTQKDNVHDAIAKGRHKFKHLKEFVLRGEAKKTSKLTDDQVRAIRADKRTQRVIGPEYGIDPSIVSEIRTRKAWRHIQ